MFLHRRNIFRASLLCAILMASQAFAARGYQRLSFTFDQPAQMKILASGNQLVLDFTQPVTLSPAQMRGKLGPHATDVTLGKDGKQVIITLDASYHTRQFVSGNTVGLDILTGSAGTPAAGSPILTTKQEPEAKLETEVLQEVAKPAPPILTTKEEPQPFAPEPKAAIEQPTPPEAPTVPTPPAAPAVVASEEPVTAEQPAETTPPAAAEESVSTQPLKAPASTDDFLVTAHASEIGTWINFPWTTRVATVVFERAEDLWIIFSEPQNINTKLLHPLLPSSVAAVEQFRVEGFTVLRLTTNGSLHATARQPKGSYQWQMLITQRKPVAALDTLVTGESDGDNATHLLFGLHDMDKPLKFYDPRIGDLVVAVPTYEEGRGVVEAKQFPAINVLATQQGVVVTSLRDDITTNRSRVGLKLDGILGLSVSPNLPTITSDAIPIKNASPQSNVMIPYEQWYIPPGDYIKIRAERLRNAANATPAARPDALFAMVQLTLGQGYEAEAKGYLDLIRAHYPDYYRANQLALLHAACNLLMQRPDDAAEDIAAPELAELEETELWKDAINLFKPIPSLAVADAQQLETKIEQSSVVTNAGATVLEDVSLPPTINPNATEFDYLGYNKPFIRFYPPRIRQKLAILAAEYYLKSGGEEKALAVYDTLNIDNILKPIQPYAEYALGKIAAKKNQTQQAIDIFKRLSEQQGNLYIQSLARYEDAVFRYKNGQLTVADATTIIEHVRFAWRGDAFERALLGNLATIYKENNQFDNTLRTWKYIITSFPNDPDTLAITGDMGDLFQSLFIGGEADKMPVLKSLALFYEFRELTPIGEKGDEIIQRLADRLAAVDLLDRAAKLLEHQIKFRVGGEARARIGARLALISLLNQEPARALDVLQTTNYGGASQELQRERQQLMAQALSRLGKNEEALSMLYSDTSREGGLLRLDILWGMQDWPNIVNQAEDVLAERPNLTDPLNPQETEVLLKLALAYSFEGDYTQLGYLRDYYMGLVPESPIKEIFSFVTNDTAPIDTEDFELVTKQITNTESFLNLFREKIAAGKLSETL